MYYIKIINPDESLRVYHAQTLQGACDMIQLEHSSDGEIKLSETYPLTREEETQILEDASTRLSILRMKAYRLTNDIYEIESCLNSLGDERHKESPCIEHLLKTLKTFTEAIEEVKDSCLVYAE